MTWEPGSHGSTFGGNPVSCAAALATLRLIENEYLQNAAIMGDYILAHLHEMQERHPLIGDVRGKGLMIGIEFVQDEQTGPSARDLRERVIQYAFEHGLLLLGAGEGVIRLMPPLLIDQALADESLAILDQAITAVEERALK
jgi:4-aminobutyrate aminotransferase